MQVGGGAIYGQFAWHFQVGLSPGGVLVIAVVVWCGALLRFLGQEGVVGILQALLGPPAPVCPPKPTKEVVMIPAGGAPAGLCGI